MEHWSDQGKRVTSTACHVVSGHFDGYMEYQSVGPIRYPSQGKEVRAGERRVRDSSREETKHRIFTLQGEWVWKASTEEGDQP
jgi:hypothetical protein